MIVSELKLKIDGIDRAVYLTNQSIVARLIAPQPEECEIDATVVFSIETNEHGFPILDAKCVNLRGWYRKAGDTFKTGLKVLKTKCVGEVEIGREADFMSIEIDEELGQITLNF